jgi:hypothetical protein
VRSRLLVAIACAVALVLAAPFVGQVRAIVQAALPGQFRIIIASVVGVSLVAAVVAAIVRIRENRVRRYGVIAAALLAGVVYATATSTGNPDVDVVERFHFVEYGLITFLFYRVWRDRGDLGTLVAPALAAITTGIADEWLQWFIPARIGEMHDVLLNSAAIGCGLLFSLGLDPPPRLRLALAPGTGIPAAAFCSFVIVSGACFFQTVHFGYAVEDGGNVFMSRFSMSDLEDAARDRVERWRRSPPVTWRRLSREDQYLSEAAWHVQRRNELAGDGEYVAAFRENQILERFFAPVLDTITFAVPEVSRWPADQKADMASRAQPDTRRYVSDAAPYPIYTWRPDVFWVLISLFIVAAWLVCGWLAHPRRARPRRAVHAAIL